MDFLSLINVCVVTLLLAGEIFSSKATEIPFNENYNPTWGGDHVKILEEGRQVQIQIDQYSGGGFRSKQAFTAGHFRMKVKSPKNSKGIVTAFYDTWFEVKDLTSEGVDGLGPHKHDELDFELLGQNGPPYVLSTNVFVEGYGNKEQQFKLWFDPTSDFHDYEILWNKDIIMFFVDNSPIRVLKNKTKTGVKFPTLPMSLVASLWNGTQWLGATNWSKGPFFANFRGFNIRGCPSQNPTAPIKSDSDRCGWNAPRIWQLTPQQKKMYHNVRTKYMTYDYCNSNSVSNSQECISV